MTRIIFTYGLISGLIIIAGIIGSIILPGASHSEFVGYLIMLVALSAILIGVKQYRDRQGGGVIKFGKAFLIGLGIAAVASVVYVVVWEIYLAVTDYSFMTQYIEAALAAKRAAGVTGEAYQKAVAETEHMRAIYANPVLRLGMTFIEIFPVGLLVALVSAGLLRFSGFLPAKTRPTPA
ncbi:MAG: DUF4199 domain-containing protein [Caulobacter sp.]|nr:DUF4199 domain-containing protein [Caulobacter sp.]